MRRICIALAPIVFVALVFVVIVRPAPFPRHAFPDEPYRADRCTWYCHNHGCSHRTHLPDFFSHTLFDRTVLALHAGGRHVGGYVAINLLVFCALWPAAMYALWLRAWRRT